MATPITVADATNILKERYVKKKVAKTFEKEFPFLSMVQKDQAFTGRVMPVPTQTATGQGRATTIAEARANATGNSYQSFAVTRKKDYGVVILDREVLLASEDAMTAWLSERTAEIDGIREAVRRNLGFMLWGNSGGARGQRASLASGWVTLANPDDVERFEQGMTLTASATDGTSGSIRAGKAKITKVDRSAGKLYSADWASITGFADNDYLFVSGDFGKMVHGVPSWTVAGTVDPADSFLGVNRSVDRDRLAGIYDDVSGLSGKREQVLGALKRMHRSGKHPDVVWTTPTYWWDMATELQDAARFDMGKKNQAYVGFEALRVITDKGPVDVLADPGVPAGYIFPLRTDAWCLHSLGEAAGLIEDEKGNLLHQQVDDDAYEIRVGFLGELVCWDTSAQGIFKVA